MKIRQGFVSNSSSSSFCIYGICIEEDKIKKAFIKKGFATKKELEDGVENFIDAWSYSYDLKNKYELSDEEIAEKIKNRPFSEFEIYNPYYDSGVCYFGISWKNIGDKETGEEFKKRIEEKIEDIFGKKIECETLEEAWHD